MGTGVTAVKAVHQLKTIILVGKCYFCQIKSISLLRIMNIMKPAPFEAFKACEAFVKISNQKNCQYLPSCQVVRFDGAS